MASAPRPGRWARAPGLKPPRPRSPARRIARQLQRHRNRGGTAAAPASSAAGTSAVDSRHRQDGRAEWRWSDRAGEPAAGPGASGYRHSGRNASGRGSRSHGPRAMGRSIGPPKRPRTMGSAPRPGPWARMPVPKRLELRLRVQPGRRRCSPRRPLPASHAAAPAATRPSYEHRGDRGERLLPQRERQELFIPIHPGRHLHL
jgi:hypothetical protein